MLVRSWLTTDKVAQLTEVYVDVEMLTVVITSVSVLISVVVVSDGVVT
jgi:hypothetical protein